jgi:hypothetical protein
MRFATTLTTLTLLLLTPLAMASPDHIPGPPHQASDNRIPSGSRHNQALEQSFRASIHSLATAYKQRGATLGPSNARDLYGLKQQALHGSPRVELEERKIQHWTNLKGVSKSEARRRFSDAVRRIQYRMEEQKRRDEERREIEERRRREEEKRRQMAGWWADRTAGREGSGDVKTAWAWNQMIDNSFV